jgi:farnesyl-diphosphate farnesyltransferase
MVFARGIIGRVSRTFAIGISVLPGDLGKAVLVGYLLCRIADTVEDDGTATAARRQALLARFCNVLRGPAAAESFASEASDIAAADAYLDLLRGTKLVSTCCTPLRQSPLRSSNDGRARWRPA